MNVPARPPLGRKDLTLLLPDWQHLDTVRRSALPFVLWQVGDQPLLFHWLDYAVDERYESVTVVCGDRPAEVRRALESTDLWPVKWSVVSVPKAATLESAFTVNRLPEHRSQAPSPPRNGWDLLDLWFALRRQWFELMASREENGLRWIALGRYCSIHPSAELRMPVWIEDHVHIGPGTIVGPNVNLGRGTMLEGPSEIVNSVVTEFTYLAGHTELSDAYLDGGMLLSLRHRARIDGIDMMVASSLRDVAARPGALERLQALALYLMFSAAALVPLRRFGRRSSAMVRDESAAGQSGVADLRGSKHQAGWRKHAAAARSSSAPPRSEAPAGKAGWTAATGDADTTSGLSAGTAGDAGSGADGDSASGHASAAHGRRTPPRTTSDGLVLRDDLGPLWRRRRRWLLEVARGRLHLFGVLPRTQEQLERLSPDWREILVRAPRGVFSYADLHGAHDPDDDMEAIHAVYQATARAEEMEQVLRANLWRLLSFSRP